MTTASQLQSSNAAILARRTVLGPAYRLFYDEPLAPLLGEDVWLCTADGRRYLDAYNNVPVVGHCHPHVVEALSRQSSRLNTHTRYLHHGILDYAERLVAKLPESLDTIMFTCTGSEANDLALRLARVVTGRQGLIVTRNAYHGVTAALADMSPSLQAVAPHVRTIPPPDNYRGSGRLNVAEAFAAEIEEAIADLGRSGLAPAALMVDTVFASDGIFPGVCGSLAAAAKVIRAHGGLFIADEVQGGFGRTGGRWWGFAHDDVIPDIVTMGKPMGNGHPIGGMVARADLVTEFGHRGRYFNTFGGNTVSAAVGQAVLDVIENQGLVESAAEVGDYLASQLAGIASMHKAVGDLRGMGLYRGVDLIEDRASKTPATELAARVVNRLRHDGVLIGTSAREANVLKIRPPLTFTRRHADQLVDALDSALRLD